MIVSLILANPKPGSFNHAIAQAALQTFRQNGYCVSFYDFYLEGFDPVMPYKEIQIELL
jgi:NAD(P)H dehydrogenase (quinone)